MEQDADITADVDKTRLLLGLVSSRMTDLISTGADGVKITSLEGESDFKLGLFSSNITTAPSFFVDLKSPPTNLMVKKANTNTPKLSRDIITHK